MWLLVFSGIFLGISLCATSSYFGKNKKPPALLSATDSQRGVICYRFAYHDGIQCYKLQELAPAKTRVEEPPKVLKLNQ